eukprot:1871305-Lingulodinium_polyedra.AAC.1
MAVVLATFSSALAPGPWPGRRAPLFAFASLRAEGCPAGSGPLAQAGGRCRPRRRLRRQKRRWPTRPGVVTTG